jgi:hypothetical protein
LFVLCAAARPSFGAADEVGEFVAVAGCRRRRLCADTGWDPVANAIGSIVAALPIGSCSKCDPA